MFQILNLKKVIPLVRVLVYLSIIVSYVYFVYRLQIYCPDYVARNPQRKLPSLDCSIESLMILFYTLLPGMILGAIVFRPSGWLLRTFWIILCFMPFSFLLFLRIRLEM